MQELNGKDILSKIEKDSLLFTVVFAWSTGRMVSDLAILTLQLVNYFSK